MKYADLDLDLIANIENLATGSQKPVVAFDADGTLWDTDVGEIVFAHQCKHLDLKIPPEASSSPWHYYQDLKIKDPRSAYLWLAQILEGLCIKDVLACNEEAYLSWENQNGPIPIFPAQQALIQHLKGSGVEVYIVTASVRWSVFPGANRLGLETKNVLGVQTELVEGLVSTKQKGFITYRDGKANAIRSVLNGRDLIFSCGNTMGDFELLKASQGISLAVSASTNTEELFATEQELKQKAKELGWHIHSFR